MTKRTRAAAASSSTPPEPDASSSSTPDNPALPTPDASPPQEGQADQDSQEKQTDERRPYEEWGAALAVKSWELAAMRVRENWPAGQLLTREAFTTARKAARTEVIEQ